jgi:hypothetical protein
LWGALRRRATALAEGEALRVMRLGFAKRNVSRVPVVGRPARFDGVIAQKEVEDREPNKLCGVQGSENASDAKTTTELLKLNDPTKLGKAHRPS